MPTDFRVRGRETEREGGRERGRKEGGKEGRREGRKEGGKEGRKRERNINMREKHQSAASHTHLDWELNLQPRYVP